MWKATCRTSQLYTSRTGWLDEEKKGLGSVATAFNRKISWTVFIEQDDGNWFESVPSEIFENESLHFECSFCKRT